MFRRKYMDWEDYLRIVRTMEIHFWQQSVRRKNAGL